MKTHWAGYFVRLYQADPLVVELDVRGISIADPSIKCELPSFVETRAVVKQLRGVKASGICGINAEFLKTGGNAVIVSLHAVLCSVWSIGIIPTDWKGASLSFSGKGMVIARTATITARTLLSVPGKVFAGIILHRVRYHLLEHQCPEQSGFTPKSSTIDHILALRVLTEHR